MKKYNHLLIAGIFLLMAFGCSKKPTPEGIQTIAELKTLFADPPSDYRPKKGLTSR